MKQTLNINKNYMNDNSEKLQLTKYCEWKGCNKKGSIELLKIEKT